MNLPHFRDYSVLSWLLVVLVSLSAKTYAKDESEVTTGCTKALSNEIKNLGSANELAKWIEVTEKWEVAYRKNLGLRADPLLFALSVSDSARKYNRMQFIRTDSQSVKPSALALISAELQSFQSDSEFNDSMARSVLELADELYSNPNTPVLEQQAQLLALQELVVYLDRFIEVESSKEQAEHASDNENESEHYPNTSRVYEHTSMELNFDMADEGEFEREPVVLAHANFRATYFKQDIINEIVRGRSNHFRKVKAKGAKRQIGKFRNTPETLTIYPTGKDEVDLFLPSGYRPLSPEDPSLMLTQGSSGVYRIKIRGGKKIKSIEVPMVEEEKSSLNPLERDFYSRPIGFEKSEWPHLIQEEIIQALKGEKDEYKIAKTIQRILVTKYLYSANEPGNVDPIQALEKGQFNCYWAAFSMMGLLRDHFSIPSRIIAGRKAVQKRDDSASGSYIVIPGTEGHAWVEAFVDGRWQVFDPTPTIDADPQDSEESEVDEESEYVEIPEDDEFGLSDTEETDEENDGAQSGGSNASDDTDEETPGADQQDRELGQWGVGPLGKIEFGSIDRDNPLLEFALKSVFSEVLDPSVDGRETATRLHQSKSLAEDFHNSKVSEVLSQALKVYHKSHIDLKSAIQRLRKEYTQQPVSETYEDLKDIYLRLQLYLQFLDSSDKSQIVKAISDLAYKILGKMNELSNPDQARAAEVKDFFNSLPVLAREYLESQYNYNSSPDNLAVESVFDQLRKGSLADLQTLAYMSHITDFILDGTPSPETTSNLTWQRNYLQPVGTHLMPLTDIRDGSRAILTQSGKSLEQNMIEGTAFVPITRETVDVPGGNLEENKERTTVVLFDVSPSMDGKPLEFQAALLAAMVSQAMGDRATDGRIRHKIALIPFAQEPGEPVVIESQEQAFEFLSNIKKYKGLSEFGNLGSGTDIQGVLLKALEHIERAESESDGPLAQASIVLLSDGGSDVDLKQIVKARDRISRSTPLQAMFVAIADTNPELKHFAESSVSLGMTRSFYREYLKDEVEMHLKRARETSVGVNGLAGALDFDLDPPMMQLKLGEDINRLNSMISRWTRTGGDQAAGLRIHRAIDYIDSLKSKSDEKDSGLLQDLNGLMSFLNHPEIKRLGIRQGIVRKIFVNFVEISGREISDLAPLEREKLKFILEMD